MPPTRIIIVVPCYNEARRLDVSSFRRCAAAMPDVQFLFVNDGSTDATAAVLESLRVAAPRSFALIHLPGNVGKAEAVRAGMLAASEMSPEHVGFWDADLATPLAALPAFGALLEERPEIDLVMGSRVRLLGRRIERRTVRHYAGRMFATAASIVLGVAVYDTQCGAKLFRFSEQVRQVFLAPFHSRWIFDVEILARLLSSRRTAGLDSLDNAVYELPLSEWRDVGGSKVRLRDFAAAGLNLIGIYWRYIRVGAPVTPQPALRSTVQVNENAGDSAAPAAREGAVGTVVLR